MQSDEEGTSAHNVLLVCGCTHVHDTVPLEPTLCTEPPKDVGPWPLEESTRAALPLITCQQARPAPPRPEIQVSEQHQPEGSIEEAGQHIARPILAFCDV